MKLTVKTLQGELHDFEMDPDTTIDTFRAIFCAQHFPEHDPETVKIIHSGNILADDATISAVPESDFAVAFVPPLKNPAPASASLNPLNPTEPAPAPEPTEPAGDVNYDNVQLEPTAPSNPEPVVLDPSAPLNPKPAEPELDIGQIVFGTVQTILSDPKTLMDLVTQDATIQVVLSEHPELITQVESIVTNPSFLRNVLTVMEQQNSTVDQDTIDIIQGTEQDSPITEPAVTPTEPAAVPDDSPIAQLGLSPQEVQDVKDLIDMGFEEDYAVQIFMACDRNKTAAIGLLLGDMA